MFDTLRSRLTMLVTMTAFVVGIAISTLGFYALRTDLRDNSKGALSDAATLFAAEIAGALNMLRREAQILASAPDIRQRLTPADSLIDDHSAFPQSDEDWQEHLGELLSSVLAENPALTQVRLIGPGPLAPEIMRLNRSAAGFEVVRAEDLQNKGHEPFMQRAQALGPGESLFSDVTLNREHGAVVPGSPPTLRIVQAVTIMDGQVGGYAVINTDFSMLLDGLLRTQLADYTLTIWTESGDSLTVSSETPITMHFASDTNLSIPRAGPSETKATVAHTVPFETDNGSRFAVTLSLPRDTFETVSTKGLLSFLAMAVTMSLAAAMLATVLVSPIVVPLERLTRAVQSRRFRFDGFDLPKDGYREVRQLAASFRLVATDLDNEVRQVAWQAVHDPLSGLLNRRGFEEAMVNRSRRSGEVSLIHFDLDRFKFVNDTHGHEAGDAVIAAVGQRLANALESSDIAGRMGGDEFILLRDGGTPDSIQEFADTIMPRLAEVVVHNGRECRFGVSLGAAIGSARDLAEGKLMKQADLALYRAKEEGRGKCQIFDPEMDRRLRDRMEILRELEDALATASLEVVYMPRVTVSGFELTGFEALVRWTRGSGDLVPPSVFLPIAEEAGIIEDLEGRILERVARDINGWRRMGLSVPTIAINASARYFQHAEMMERVRSLNLSPRSVSFELQESVLGATNMTDVVWALDALRDMGIGVVIDNFGAGPSSILSLATIEPDGLNIDRALISAMGSDTSVNLLVKAIVDMAIPMGATVHAVGVESLAQIEALRQVDCGTMQGKVIGLPLHTDGVTAVLRDGFQMPSVA